MNPLHHEHYQNSDTTTDLESVQAEQKQTTGPEFYNRSNLSCGVGLVGVGVATLFGVCCICVGVISSSATYPGLAASFSVMDSWEKELFSLALNLMVTVCTEATGFVHGIALRSALASEGRLHFNTNLRLLSAAGGIFSANGTLCNVVMAILLIMSYSSTLLLAISFSVDTSGRDELMIGVSRVPLIVLGIVLLLQASIALAGVWSADILTWSSSPFDITAALVHHAQILPEPGRCMHGVANDKQQGPLKPSARQPSAWGAHRCVRKVVLTLWLLVLFCVVWGVIIVYLDITLIGMVEGWTFFPQTQSSPVTYPTAPLEGAYYFWPTYYMNMAAIQGPLTLGLHCSELIVNLIRDERVWRKATTTKGLTISSHPLAFVFGSPLNVILLTSKPLLHWMFGLAMSFSGGELLNTQKLAAQSVMVDVSMWPFQIFNLSVALFVFSLVLTVIVLLRPSGPQPAAYGHIQTLANLIDEWSPTMWWGYKSPGHAGTSDVRLGKVDMNALYGCV